MNYPSLRTQAGSTLIEVLVAIALTGIMLPTLAAALVTSQRAKPSSMQQLQAQGLLDEANEAVRSIREAGWDNIASSGTFHPVIAGSKWSLSGGPETINQFSRDIVVSSVNRDSSGSIVRTGGSLDPATKHITITVSWETPYHVSISSDTYLTQWQQQTTWMQTSVTDFSTGTFTDTVGTSAGDGGVELANTGSYVASGSFESVTFNAGHNVEFLGIDLSATQDGGSTIGLQVAVNDDDTTWNYVGPDGTNASYFTTSSPLPLNIEAGQYLRFRAYLSAGSSNTVTPVLQDVTVRYAL